MHLALLPPPTSDTHARLAPVLDPTMADEVRVERQKDIHRPGELRVSRV